MFHSAIFKKIGGTHLLFVSLLFIGCLFHLKFTVGSSFSCAVCCSVMHCLAACCSVLQCAAECLSNICWRHGRHSLVLQCVAVCCSVLLCVAVPCSVLQRVAECRSVL